MKRIISCVMVIVLALGLMPLPAFARLQTGSGELQVIEETGGAIAGLQLNDSPSRLAPYQSSPAYGVLWSYIEAGDVIVEFEGTVVPRLAMRNKDNSNAWIFAKSNDVTWNADKTAGHARFSPDLVRQTWLSGKTGEAPNVIDDLRKLYVQADSAAVTVKRIVLTGAEALPDVSRGAYGQRTVRRLYTRPVTLKTSPDSGKRLYRTVNIDFDNPVYDGADIAVRYTGDMPYLQFCDENWNGWTNMGIGEGARTATADDGTGERVTFFTRQEIETLWRERGGANGAVQENMFVCVHPQSATYPEGAEECRIVEVVAIGGAERVELTESQRSKVHGLTVEQIARNMGAGYNMAGHFESNWVPDEPAKDGGWSYSDLELEAQWARGVYITRELLHSLKVNGFSAIRLPITWFQHIYPEGDPISAGPLPSDPLARYHIDRAWMERVHEVVDWCIAEDLYVIINIHHEDWIDRPDLGTAYDETDLPVKFKAVWTQIANEFSGYDQRLVFEDMNEPHAFIPREDGTKDWGFSTAETVETVNRLNADFVKLMRSYPQASGHTERVLMMAHDTGNGDVSYTNFVMPYDPARNLAHSLHGYAPHDWTHYFANGEHPDESGEANVFDDIYRTAAESFWDNMRARYTSQGYPVILGEFGCYYLGEERQQDRADWMELYATRSKELGIPMFYWRMDRTIVENGKERVGWSAFDEEELKVSSLSKDMIAKWFEILKDPGIYWGSNARILEGEHAPITDASKINAAGFPKEIHFVESGSSDSAWRATVRVTAKQLKGCEVAVKYTGSTPRLGLIRESADENGKTWQGDWWGMSPTTVDVKNGIAYFTFDAIASWWASRCPTYDLSTLSHLAIRVPVSGYSPPTAEDRKLSTTIESVAIVHEHVWGNWVQTSTSSGGEVVQTRTCAVASCADNTQVRTVHEWGRWSASVEPTCTKPGVDVRVCLHDSTRQERNVSARGHEWEEKVTVDAQPTCTQAGSKSVHCRNCDERRDVEEIPATGHDWEASATVDVEATCTQAGSKSVHCRNCDERRDVEAIPATGHVWGDWTTAKAATYEEEGEEARVCAHDPSHVETRAIAKLVKDPETDPGQGGAGQGEDPSDDPTPGKTDDPEPGKTDDSTPGKADDPTTNPEPGHNTDPAPSTEPGHNPSPAPGTEPGQSTDPAPGTNPSPGAEQEHNTDPTPGPTPSAPEDPATNPEPSTADDPAENPDSKTSDAPTGGTDSKQEGAAAEEPQAKSGIHARAGSIRLTIDVDSNGKASIVRAPRSTKGALKANVVKTRNGKKYKVSEIEGYAFYKSKLTSVRVGDNVTRIGGAAFKNCHKLSAAVIGKNVRTVGMHVFKGCEKLKVLNVRSNKLTRDNLRNLVSGSSIQTVKLTGMPKLKKRLLASVYEQWLPAGVTIR